MSRSSTTIEADEDQVEPVTPGEILLEEFLGPIGMSQTSLAKAVGVSPRRINEIVLGKRAITADTDLRLCRYWGLSDGFFLRLQDRHDLLLARRRLGPELDKITPRAA
jgi:addiction module HigA family antidote